MCRRPTMRGYQVHASRQWHRAFRPRAGLPFYKDLVVDSVAGSLASANDQGRLAEHVIRQLNDPELGLTLERPGQALVRRRYDWKSLSGQLLRASEQATGQSSLAQVGP